MVCRLDGSNGTVEERLYKRRSATLSLLYDIAAVRLLGFRACDENLDTLFVSVRDIEAVVFRLVAEEFGTLRDAITLVSFTEFSSEPEYLSVSYDHEEIFGQQKTYHGISWVEGISLSDTSLFFMVLIFMIESCFTITIQEW